ncbi:hypothetical protein F4553_004685 [Allocatelliglobosispora scoriae]|uniref:Lipoprotein n=1 Tax=Allocatelliglobosispora scoriae TaxID=643052 RepID=A0A841BV18_9ACTN|nr:hypothetical protein [Allocatelliglobosispora scoriae]MBB5871306.1 hypothetical protein [Allocatelliglobosispora scoriae]
MNRTVAGFMLVVGLSTVAGCADQPDPSASPTAPVTSPAGSGLPTMTPPTAPPKSPTDALPTDVVVGRITKGGTGPCYGLITDDDKQYALYSTAGTTLTEGQVVRVQTAPLLIKIYCGPGEHRSIVKVEPVS